MKKMSIIKKTLPFGREKLVLPPEKDGKQRLSRLKENETMLTIFLTIKTLKSGDYFGVGESMKDSFIITRGKVRRFCIYLFSYSFANNISNLKEKGGRTTTARVLFSFGRVIRL